MNAPSFRLFALFFALGAFLLVAGEGCKSLSKAEVTAARKSEESLCKAVVDCYRRHDLKAFAQLAMSPGQIKDMMNHMNLPENARRESIKNKGAFVEHMQDSLQTVLTAAQVDWSTAALDRFVPTRKPIEMATGYKYCLGTMRVKVGDKILAQPFTLVEAEGGKFFVGDFGPFEASK
jgi:hypothetical protein